MPDPMYRQIAEDPRKQIESGALGHGDQLPTEPELRETYDASRNTVRDAVKWLITRGLVETRPGQGSFVVGKIDPYVTILTGEPEKSGDEEGPVYAKGTRGAGRGGRRKRPRPPSTTTASRSASLSASIPQTETSSSSRSVRFLTPKPPLEQTPGYSGRNHYAHIPTDCR